MVKSLLMAGENTSGKWWIRYHDTMQYRNALVHTMYPACNQAGMNRNCLSMLAVARNAATGVDNKGMPVLLTK